MNMLFGTDFSVMIAKTGRKQTTLGVWLGLSPPDEGEKRDTDTVLVLDVEGTDSRERGEDHGAFERKTSLFSLALSEILIINMWTTDVGLYDGANYSLLKIVFELNLQLFQQAKANDNKTCLLFLFRDHTLPEDEEHTPLEHFVSVINEDMEKIWNSISKSEEWAKSKVTDFFDFKFVSLPHKVHKSKAFKEQVEQLKHRFLDPSNEERILSQHYKKDIPADGFARYAENIWNTILDNKDLNIPTQKEMLSMFRCEQMANAALDHFTAQIDALRQTLEAGKLVSGFGGKISEYAEEAYQEYDPGAKRYVSSVASAKRNELTDRMATSASKLLQEQLRLAFTSEIALLNDALKKKISSQKGPIPNFTELVDEISDAAISSFNQVAADSHVAQFDSVATYSAKEQVQIFEQTVRDRIKAVRRDQFLALRAASSKAFERSLSAWISAYLEAGGSKANTSLAPSPSLLEISDEESSPTIPRSFSSVKATSLASSDSPQGGMSPSQSPKLSPLPPSSSGSSGSSSMTLAVKVTPGLVQTWADIQEKYEAARKKFLDEMSSFTATLIVDESEASQELKDSKIHCSSVLAKVFQDLTANIGWMMERRFSSTFKLDENRLPRRWKPGDDLDGEFKRSCLQAERLLDQISVIRLNESERGFSWLEPISGTNNVIAPKSDIDAVPESISVMSLSEVTRALEQFREKARADYLQATQAQETAVKGSYTVMVALIIFLIFGWDEVMYLLTNPFALFLVVVLGAGAFVAHHLNLFPVIAPIVNTFVATLSKAVAGGLQQGAANYASAPSSAPPIKEKTD